MFNKQCLSLFLTTNYDYAIATNVIANSISVVLKSCKTFEIYIKDVRCPPQFMFDANHYIEADC